MPLSKVLERMMSVTAWSMSALFSMKAGTLPGPTPRAGLPQLYAALTIAAPPVARIRATSGLFIRALVLSIVGCSIHWMQFSGAPAFTAASCRIFAAAALQACADGWKPNIIGLRVLMEINALNIVVDVGLVTGVIPITMPTGSAIFWKLS
ncbi:hypothetical protein D3C71_1125140 [compost metagenome]